MPDDNFTLHFGVAQVNLDDVIPGVDGLETIHDGDRWDLWGVALPTSPPPSPPAPLPLDVTNPFASSRQDRSRFAHIKIHTSDPRSTLVRVLRAYGTYLRPGANNGYDLYNLVVVTNRWDNEVAYYEGCFNLTAPINQPGEDIVSLNANQGYVDEYDDDDDNF